MCCRNEKPMKNVTLLGMSELMKNTMEVFSLLFFFRSKEQKSKSVYSRFPESLTLKKARTLRKACSKCRHNYQTFYFAARAGEY